MSTCNADNLSISNQSSKSIRNIRFASALLVKKNTHISRKTETVMHQKKKNLQTFTKALSGWNVLFQKD